uniref:Beta-1,4 N-acetylgalactosaminyltransferase 1-like n=1 Tax=Saccoglossus kowalevskii TaxID=10224 RepID=A0ABM0MBR1_SACKO|nr:PREDICTED: beta-1,4 N-acetylgalactosaminyltransferase 1-like [Saccoglossus kowalevskii]
MDAKSEPMVLCRMISPMSYVGGGIIVEPLKSVKIVEGNATSTLKLSFSSPSDNLNSLLEKLVYRSIVYDIDIRDTVEVKLIDFNVVIHIHVRKKPRPRLYNLQQMDDISRKVTIVTKTFERYNCIETLVRSVNTYYPDMQIIVADDSEEPQTIDGLNVLQYIMPYKEGWFAGRNLVLSQVKTKYFVWVDDDFIFTADTKLENFVEKLEDPRVNLDMIGAFFEDVNGTKYIQNMFFKTVEIVPGDEDGNCMARGQGFQRNIEEYPQCMLVDLVTNFFMAKTQTIRAIGFDPEFERVGHTEFFLDGFGRMRVASCKDVFILHKSENSVKYSKFRRGSVGSHIDLVYGHEQYVMFKNNLKCYRLG